MFNQISFAMIYFYIQIKNKNLTTLSSHLQQLPTHGENYVDFFK